MNDPRTWEKRGDEAQIKKVIQRLVDDARRRRIGPCDPFDVRCRQLLGSAWSEQSRVRKGVGVSDRRKLFQNRLAVARLTDTKHVRMIGEDLVDQRAPRARHADDENGNVRVQAPTARAFEEM